MIVDRCARQDRAEDSAALTVSRRLKNRFLTGAALTVSRRLKNRFLTGAALKESP
jgi:hypothetical protein